MLDSGGTPVPARIRLLLPALMWLATRWPGKVVLLWSGAAAIAWLAQYSSGAYLVMLLVVALVLARARQRPPLLTRDQA
jgi:hypothetical protein